MIYSVKRKDNKTDIVIMLFEKTVLIATYKTEERAKKVLEEFYKFYGIESYGETKNVSAERAIAYGNIAKYKRFFMPIE